MERIEIILIIIEFVFIIIEGIINMVQIIQNNKLEKLVKEIDNIVKGK